MPLGLGKWIGCSSGHNETGFQIWKKRCTGLLEFCRHPCRPLDAALNKPTPFLCWCELQGASFKRGYQLIYYSVRRVERHLIQEIETIRLPVFDKKSVGNAKVEVFPIIHPHRILKLLVWHCGSGGGPLWCAFILGPCAGHARTLGMLFTCFKRPHARRAPRRRGPALDASPGGKDGGDFCKSSIL